MNLQSDLRTMKHHFRGKMGWVKSNIHDFLRYSSVVLMTWLMVDSIFQICSVKFVLWLFRIILSNITTRFSPNREFRTQDDINGLVLMDTDRSGIISQSEFIASQAKLKALVKSSIKLSSKDRAGASINISDPFVLWINQRFLNGFPCRARLFPDTVLRFNYDEPIYEVAAGGAGAGGLGVGASIDVVKIEPRNIPR